MLLQLHEKYLCVFLPYRSSKIISISRYIRALNILKIHCYGLHTPRGRAPPVWHNWFKKYVSFPGR